MKINLLGHRRHSMWLTIFTGLFALRVAGQLTTAFIDVGFLPLFANWSSGILPYPLLLPLQLLLLVTMAAIVRDVTRGTGFFATLPPHSGRIMQRLAYIYATAMVVRYVVMMSLHPQLRWFTGTTPIWFHFVLATFLFTLGHFHTSRTNRPEGLPPA